MPHGGLGGLGDVSLIPEGWQQRKADIGIRQRLSLDEPAHADRDIAVSQADAHQAMPILAVAGNRSILKIALSILKRPHTSITNEFYERWFIEQTQNEFRVIDHELTNLETRCIKLQSGR